MSIVALSHANKIMNLKHRFMKELITILYGQDIEEFKGFTLKQKLAYIYVVVSFALFLLCACCNSIVAILVALVNMLMALAVAFEHIPNFNKEEE